MGQKTRVFDFMETYYIDQGIWWGMMTGTFVQSIVLTWMICKTNWDKEVKNQKT